MIGFLLTFLIPILHVVPNEASTSGKLKKSKLIPKPLPPNKTPKSRKQARVASKAARAYETVDLLTQQNTKVNLLNNITLRPVTPNPIDSGVQQLQVEVATGADDFSDYPLTQNVINTVFIDNETNDALEALMATFDENQYRVASPDIFEEDEHAYEGDTIGFMDEKIALLQTKIEILKADDQKLLDEEQLLQKKTR